MEGKSTIYRTQMLPLIQQLNRIAIEHGMPFVLVVQSSDEGHERSAYIPASAHEEMRQLWKWLEQWHPYWCLLRD
jgi:hypothetical protein